MMKNCRSEQEWAVNDMWIYEKRGSNCVEPCEGCEHHIEVVEVVRCKNCKHADTTGTLYCFYWCRNTVEDGYCHEGV